MFQEFPKWVRPEGKEPCIAQNVEEEAEALGVKIELDSETTPSVDKPRRGRPPASQTPSEDKQE